MSALFALYLALPAFIANMAPVAAARWRVLPRFDRPLDGGRSVRGRRLFGAHKTVRGLVVGTAAGALTALGQWLLPPFAGSLPYATAFSALAFGAAAGFGALAGDAVKSLFKRQLDIANGRPFIPFDYIDYVVGFLICTAPWYAWNGVEIAWLLFFALVANPLTNCLSYYAGIKRTAW